ncbi:retrovirus-related pol polyprotein from transposon TNT 1-94 [Tanacetum coccineum]
MIRIDVCVMVDQISRRGSSWCVSGGGGWGCWVVWGGLVGGGGVGVGEDLGVIVGGCGGGECCIGRNKRDETGIVIKNKARLVAQGYNQLEGIYYDETFTPIARLEAIRIFFAFATYMNFIFYQMDIKSAFPNGKLKEEVYVKQPPGFESSEFPNHVCKLDKALYGLKQAPRAWYETLSTYLTEHKFVIVKTPMVPPNKLGPDLNGKAINETQYRGMIGSLMYLKGTPSLGLWYPKCLGFVLKGYSDSDYAGCNMDRKNILAEAEYVAAAECCANILWMKSQLTDYDIIYEKVPIFCDNTSTIAISNNLVLHSRTKHIDIRYHFIRDHILKGDIELHFIPTQYQLADIFTKPLDEPTFKRLIIELGGIRGKIGITTFRNALRAHYLPHSSEYVSLPSLVVVRPWFATIGYNREIWAKGTLKKSCLPHRWRLLMAQIIQCLGDGVQVDFAKIIWEDIIHKLNKKTRENVVPYPWFISLFWEYMMPEYDHEDLTINPTQVFSVHNWALKPKQPEGPPFTDHMQAICNIDVPVESQALTTSSKTEMKVPQGKKPRARKTQSSSAKDKSPSHLSSSTPVVGDIHKEAQQAAGGSTYLGATSEEGAHPQLSSGCDASVDSIAKADLGKSAPNDSIPSQQGMDEGTKNYSIDHIFAGTNPSVLIDKTKFARDGLKTAHTNLGTNEESRSDEILKKINLEDLSDFMQDTRSAFLTPDFPQDEPIIVSDEGEEEETERYKDTHTTSYDGPEDTSIPHPPSPKSIQIQKLMAQVHLLQSQKDELEQQKAKAEPEVASLKAKPLYPDINQLT